MMSAFVEEAIRIAQWEDLYAWERNLRAHLEAREAVTQRLAEALRKTKTCGLATEVRDVVNHALQAYEEVNK